MAAKLLLLAVWATSATAEKLWASSYAGTVSALELNGKSLKAVSSSTDCGKYPAWLALDKGRNLQKPVLYCVNEGWDPPAGFSSLSVSGNKLTKISSLSTLGGPVSSEFYNQGQGKGAVALAHYGEGGISTFLTNAAGELTPLENFTFTIAPGPRPQQDKSHVHQAVIDPTGKFLVFPDLGADVTRVYAIDANTSKLKELSSVKADAGSGPRHAVFWSPSSGPGPKPNAGCGDSKTFFFVIHELSNHITGYSVTYPSAGQISFTKIQDIGLFGKRDTPVGAAAAELIVSPDNKFILASNRNASIFTVANPDPTNSTQIPSDSIATFKPSTDGKLEFIDLVPSGGQFPRHFSLNPKGDLLAAANGVSETITIWKRDVASGKIGERVAVSEKLGNVNFVLWD